MHATYLCFLQTTTKKNFKGFFARTYDAWISYTVGNCDDRIRSECNAGWKMFTHTHMRDKWRNWYPVIQSATNRIIFFGVIEWIMCHTQKRDRSISKIHFAFQSMRVLLFSLWSRAHGFTCGSSVCYQENSIKFQGISTFVQMQRHFLRINILLSLVLLPLNQRIRVTQKNALKKKDFQPFLGKAIDWENIDAKKIYSEISQIAASLILLLLFVSQRKVPLSVIETIWKNHWRILHIQSLISFVIFIWKRTKIYKSVLSTIILIGMQCMHKNVIANWNETKLSFRMFMLRWIGERVRLPMKSHKNQFSSIFP